MPTQGTLCFPDQLIVRLVEERTGRPVPNIALTVTLFATRKNDYHFGPDLSDPSGTIRVSRDWVERSIHGTADAFPMDYSCDLAYCRAEVRLTVMSLDEVRRAIAAMELYGEASVRSMGVAHSITDLRNASNGDFQPQAVTVRLDAPCEEVREVTIELRPRLRPADHRTKEILSR